MEKLTASLKEYLEELLYKVVVFVASVLLAILIFIMDALFKLGLQDGLYSLFS
jgi:uncharacterized membrane protein